MPCSMMHIKCALEYEKNIGKKLGLSFVIGNISPDVIDQREFKDINHLRIYKDISQRNEKLIELAKGYDLCDEYQLGVILHLYTDMLWDHGPMAKHKREYVGDNWFTDYRGDIRDISRYMFLQYEWAPPLWDDMCELGWVEDVSLALYPVENIKNYLSYNHNRHKQPGAIESSKFPHRDMDQFCVDTAKSFCEWMKLNFNDKIG